MNSFTISQLQRYSGISVHSIRAWEKRYNALQPGRSEGNTRQYNGKQLRRLLNIAGLLNSDYKISELCALSDSKLYDLMNKNLEESIAPAKDEFLILQMIAAALEFNESLFDKVFSRAVMNYSIEGAYTNILYPVLRRLGIFWTMDKIAPAQEHFISNLIRQKLSSSIDLIPVNGNSKKHWLLFLPENEFHENGLLLASYLIRNAGERCTYLGANVPFESLQDAVKQIKPTALLFFLVAKDDAHQDNDLISLMLKSFPKQKIFVASEQQRLSTIKSNKNFTPLSSVDSLKEAIHNV